MRLTLRKDEKLRHKKLVEDLFSGGESLYDFPLRVVWRKLSAQELKDSFRAEIPDKIGPVQMLITVPKRKLRHAVDRVLMRRRIREAYRLNRLPLKNRIISDPEGSTLCISFIYIADKTLPYSTVEEKMIRILSKLNKRISSSISTDLDSTPDTTHPSKNPQ